MDHEEVLAKLDFEYPITLTGEEKANWDALREHYANDPDMLVKMDLALVRMTEVVQAALEGRDPREAWSE